MIINPIIRLAKGYKRRLD